MSTSTGAEIVASIESLLSRQAVEAQEAKQVATLRLLGAFTQKHSVPPQTGAISTLSRLLRKLDSGAVRQVRSLSDSLLDMDESALESELLELRDELMPIGARVHQVKTKTAFIFTVLRPFSSKYTTGWFQDRNDIDVKQIQSDIERLERYQFSNPEDLSQWAVEVASLFESLVVYRGSDANEYYARPTGTVNEKSSRTYLQAWQAFSERFRNEIWDHTTGKSDGRTISMMPMSFTQDDFKVDNEDFSEAPKKFSLGNRISKSDPLKLSRDSLSRSSSPHAPRKPKFSESSESSEWIQVFIESKIDSSAQATRKWDSQQDFRLTLQKWLDTLPLIWGSAATQFVAKVSVKTQSGESDLTLPSLTVDDAADRLTTAVNMQLD
jgi:hypothetical protein